MTPADEIVARYRSRMAAKGTLHAMMRAVRESYNGEMVVPLPELDRNERSAVANLIATGTDQLGMRIASTVPNIYFPPVKPGDRASEKRASTRRRASVGWLEANKMGLKLRRRSRHLIAYSMSPVVLRPDFKREYSRWELREPLSTYEAPSADLDEITPSDCIFAFPRSYAWLKARYPDALNALFVGRDPKADDVFDLLEYVDAEETVLLGLGKQRGMYEREVHGTSMVELERIPNRTGVCPAIIPSRITLDRARGQFDDMIGPMHWMAKLMALELRATEKGVFPDSYLVSRPGETAQFISGPHDGRTGMVNIVKGGEMRDINTPPGFQTNPTLDRLAREARFTGGIPPEFGGESQGSVRTGKRGDAVLSAVVDFPVQEAQELLAASMQAELKVAIAQAKTYWGSTSKSFYVNAKGAKGNVDYTPNKDFENDNNTVTYSQAGSDANALVISGGQRVGIGTLSKRSFMELDPLVDNVELEHDRVISEALEAALMSGLQQQAQSGQIAPADLARIMELVLMDKVELAGAVQKVHEEAQARQASDPNAAPGSPAAPVDPNSPEAQPGLGTPGAGAEAGTPPPTVGAPAPGAQNLASLLSTLRQPERISVAEKRSGAVQ